MSNKTSLSASTRAAFTLIELLVVVVIIAILAAIGLAVSGSVRKLGDRAKCLSNLRQIGSGIRAYVGEHDGALPGPLWTWQSCWYVEGDSGTLGNVLARYLGAPMDSDPRRQELLVCPAWQRGGPYKSDESFLLNTEVLLNGTVINPWGDADLAKANGGVASSDPTAPDSPKMLAALSDLPLSRIWAIQDLDAQSPGRKKLRGLAAKPVHGDTRNALFFDFHVEPVPLDYQPQIP